MQHSFAYIFKINEQNCVLLFSINSSKSNCWSIYFEKYQNNNEATTINISPKMFQLLGRMSIPDDDLESKELIKMVNGIRSFKVLITSSSDIIKEIERSVESISKKVVS